MKENMARSSTGGDRGRGRDSGHNSCRTHTIGQLHSETYEAPSQHESSDDDESTVGRRGPVAPTPLPEPKNREWIWIRHDQFSNQEKATRTIGEILQAMWSHPWKSWKDVSNEDGDRMFERFKEEKLGRPATVDEIWMQSHGKKGTRPLDRLLKRERGECSADLEDINLQDNVKWVDSKAKESFIQQLNEKIARLQQEKETERLEKEKEKAEKLIIREQIEENRVANDAMKEANAEMKKQIEFLLKNITKN
ncbi:hypothetical protein R6Q57_012307 [Mikania cordata]